MKIFITTKGLTDGEKKILFDAMLTAIRKICRARRHKGKVFEFELHLDGQRRVSRQREASGTYIKA